MIDRVLPLVGHECFHSIFYDDVKNFFKNSEYIRENLPWRMELFELPILKFGDLNLKAHAFKFLMVLLLYYNILLYFNLYSSQGVTNGRCIYILLKINIEKVKIKSLQLFCLIYSWYCQTKPSSFKYLYIIWKQKLEKLIAFPSWFKHQFPWSKEEKNPNFTFTFSDIVSIRPSLFLSSFL